MTARIHSWSVFSLGPGKVKVGYYFGARGAGVGQQRNSADEENKLGKRIAGRAVVPGGRGTYACRVLDACQQLRGRRKEPVPRQGRGHMPRQGQGGLGGMRTCRMRCPSRWSPSAVPAWRCCRTGLRGRQTYGPVGHDAATLQWHGSMQAAVRPSCRSTALTHTQHQQGHDNLQEELHGEDVLLLAAGRQPGSIDRAGSGISGALCAPQQPGTHASSGATPLPNRQHETPPNLAWPAHRYFLLTLKYPIKVLLVEVVLGALGTACSRGLLVSRELASSGFLVAMLFSSPLAMPLSSLVAVSSMSVPFWIDSPLCIDSSGDTRWKCAQPKWHLHQAAAQRKAQ